MTAEAFARTIAAELSVRPDQVGHVIALFDDGNTVPFVARYRKEMTGGLDEEQLRAIESRLAYLRNLEERRETVLRSIQEQGKLTPELEGQIQSAATLQVLEDLYLPYRPKRRTRATIARERGLEPLAKLILGQPVNGPGLDELAQPFLGEAVPTAEDAWAGARDIVAETISEDAHVRQSLRDKITRQALLVSDVDDPAKDPEGKYRDYYQYEEDLGAIPPHRLLALRRGEKERVLKTRLLLEEEAALSVIAPRYPPKRHSALAGQLDAALRDSYERLLKPSVEREAFKQREEVADAHAISLFAANLKQLLLQPPLRGRRVMGLDPGFRTGSKVAVVDETGRVLETTTIYPHAPVNKLAEAGRMVGELTRKHGVSVIAIGNGTASRETESFVADLISAGLPVEYAIVSEAGASVYSASELAREELPGMDVSLRGAVSIARRLQDPLAELVKIEPKAIGVGLYQHDVDQKQLGQALDGVVESAVNHVGVDVNTASPALLQYVAGLSKRAAAAVVAYRDENGRFAGREGLMKVKGIGPKAFTQAAGFLRVPGGCNPLDNTPIHPESYPACSRLLVALGLGPADSALPARLAELAGVDDEIVRLAGALDVGEPTLRDIIDSLARPGRDPREALPAPILRKDVLKMEDLCEGMVLLGTVRNIVDFGAFVDIGVKRDGLVHVSAMARRFVRHPLEVVKVGDVVEVKVTLVDKERGRIGLSMLL